MKKNASDVLRDSERRKEANFTLCGQRKTFQEGNI